MRVCDLIFGTVLLFAPLTALAQTKAPAETVQLAGEHTPFLDEVSAVMQKYPAAAERFQLYDRIVGAKAQSKVPTSHLRWACCDHPRMPEGCAFICPK